MEQKLFDSELKVMEQLWSEGDMSAGALAKRLAAETGWNRNTTYTVIKKLVEKQAIERREPGFVCQREAESLLEKLFDGSPSLLFSAFVGGQKQLPPEEVDRLRELVDRLK